MSGSAHGAARGDGAVAVVGLELGQEHGARLRRPAATGDAQPPRPAGPVLALVRVAGWPVGVLRADVPDGADACAHLEKLAREEFAAAIAARADATTAARKAAAPAAPARTPSVTVVIATRGRTEQLARCLDSLRAQDHPDFDVVVVDNDPEDDTTATLVRERYADLATYVREDVRGLAAAHNRGVAVATGEILAFTDDDVLADPGWVRAILAGFAAGDHVACVTGLIMPAELETAAQRRLEHHGGFGKGFETRAFSLAEPPADQPLFPFTAGRLGSGANMAFRAGPLRALGGFDPATGAGTTAMGGDDLLAFFRTVVAGHTLVYRPDAVVWHHHRRTDEAVARQAYGYGVGLGAYLAAAVCREPRTLPGLLRRVPRGVRYARDNSAHAAAPASPGATVPADEAWPRELVNLERRGLLYGPVAYLRSRHRLRGVRAPWR